MPDPRAQLTAQELVYAASALRAEARRAERQAADTQFESCRTIFEGAARTYDQLAGKLTRIADCLGGGSTKSYSHSTAGFTWATGGV